MSRIFLCLSVFLFAACSTVTPYQPAVAGKHYGYSDFQIDKNHFSVSFSGNSLTDRQLVEANLLYRAAELTIQRGYDYFVVSDKETDKRTSFISSGFDSSYYSGFYWDFYGGYNPFFTPYSPYYPYRSYDPFGIEETREIIRYTVSADIELKLGKKGANEENAYNAREVLQNLDRKILKPKH